jgi:hypothetical protein
VDAAQVSPFFGMVDSFLTVLLRRLGGTPAFRIYGKGRPEPEWRTIDVFASERRDLPSPWPLLAGACTTWTSSVIAVGWDFAERLLAEQAATPASRDHHVEVAGGRIRDVARRRAAGAYSYPGASEILAHECGHTWQASRLHGTYLALVGSVTLFREGNHFWNHFENQASEVGQFGGIIAGSVCARLMERK